MTALPSHIRLSATFAALLTLVACGKSEDTTADGSSTSAATDAGSTTGTPTTSGAIPPDTTTGEPITTSGATDGMTGSTTEPATTEPATTEPATSTTTTEPGTSTGPDTTTGNPDLCLPEPTDDTCTVCTKGNCCDELTACQADQDCACMLDCLNNGGDIPTCAGTCMVNPQNSPALLAIAQCGMANCNAECQ